VSLEYIMKKIMDFTKILQFNDNAVQTAISVVILSSDGLSTENAVEYPRIPFYWIVEFL